MFVRTVRLAAVVAVTLSALSSWSVAEEPAATTITVRDLHCVHCAQKVAAKLYQVPGVALVKADVEAKLLVIEPKPERTPSPRALWEAVERAGKRPTRITGPGGTFTARPES